MCTFLLFLSRNICDISLFSPFHPHIVIYLCLFDHVLPFFCYQELYPNEIPRPFSACLCSICPTMPVFSPPPLTLPMLEPPFSTSISAAPYLENRFPPGADTFILSGVRNSKINICLKKILYYIIKLGGGGQSSPSILNFHDKKSL